MGTEVISAITLCNTNWHAHGVFCTHALHPLVQGKRMSFSSLPVRPGHAILMTNDLAPSRSRRRDRLAAICANLETIHNTPPQVDISLYRNRRARIVGRSRWAHTSLAAHRSLHVSPLKKVLVCSSWVLAVSHGKVDDTLAVTTVFQHMLAENISRRSRLSLFEQVLFLELSIHERDYCVCQIYLLAQDIQTYFQPVNRYEENRKRRRWKRTVPVMRVGLVFEKKPKPDEKKPKPDEKKPKPDEKKPKPRREGDREPREPREPNAKSRIFFYSFVWSSDRFEAARIVFVLLVLLSLVGAV